MSVAGVNVRLARAADLSDIVALERVIVEAPHWAEAVYSAMLIEDTGPVRRRLVVAEGEGGLVGFAAGKVVGRGRESFAELETVAVASKARRSGVGRRLCSAVADWSRAEGATAMELEVRASSAGAIALYTGMGFAVEGRRTAYYKDPNEDALLMRLELVGCGETSLPFSSGLC